MTYSVCMDLIDRIRDAQCVYECPGCFFIPLGQRVGPRDVE